MICGGMGSVIRHNDRINEHGSERSRQRIAETLALIKRHDGDYLMADHFSVADLAAAALALLYPLIGADMPRL